MTNAMRKSEQIIAYDSDAESDGTAGGGMPPLRSVAETAQMILSQQRSCRSAGSREAGRRKMANLGGAYRELCRGTTLPFWETSDASAVSKRYAAHTTDRHPSSQRALHTSHNNAALQTPVGGEICSGRLPHLKMDAHQPAVLMTPPPSLLIETGPACCNDDKGSDSAAATTTPVVVALEMRSLISTRERTPSCSEASLQGFDGFATPLKLSPAEVSAVELLAHEMEGTTSGCWRASQEQLSPCAIYSDIYSTCQADDFIPGAAVADSVPTPPATQEGASPVKVSKRLRGEDGCAIASSSSAQKCTARRLQFGTHILVDTPRPSVSYTVLRRYNERVQQRFTARRLLLPY